MKKRPLSVALLLSLVLAVCLAVLPTTAEAAAAPIQVTPSVTAAYPGESITVTVSVAGSTQFTSVGFIPKVNSSVYEITDRKMLSGINNAPLKAFDAQGGVVAFDTAAAYTGEYFRYTLKIKSTAPAGSYALVDSAVVMNGTSKVDIAVPTAKILVAATNITKAISDTSLQWNLNKGVLTITGTGAIPSYSATGAPWYAYRELIKTVVMDPGVTKVGANAFAGCKNLAKLTFKGSQAQWNAITVSSGNDPLKKADPVFNGFYTKNNNTYYGNNGTNVTGWKTVSGKTHYFKVGTGGTMAKGWTTIGGQKYYFKQGDGSMVTGVVTIGGIPNEFTSKGVWVRVVPAPKITKQPASAKVAVNQNATVTFTASGEGLTYKWYYKNAGASTFTYTSTFTTNTYTTVMNADRNGRQIYCVVTDKYGQTAKTNTVTISMAAAPKITKQPVSTKAANGKSLTVSFTASGEGLTYKWYYKNKGASAFAYTSTFTSNSYTTTMDATRNGRQIYCVVTDKYGQTVKTNTVTISMAAAPKITKQPVSVTTANNKSLTVSFTASGEGLTYKWYYKDASASAFTYTSTFKTNAYTTVMTAARNGRQLYCVVTDKYGQTVKTSTVTISMAAVPKITKQPVTVKVLNGQTAKVSFIASGTGLTYKWYYKNAGASTFTYTSSFTSNSYSVAMNATRNGRQLYCVVTDKYGQTAKTNTVTIGIAAAPKITKQPVSVKVANGAVAKTSVTATGEGLTYTWYVLDPGTYRWTESSIKTNTYSVAMTAAKSGRKVYCVVTDKFDRTVESNTVILSMK